VVTEVFRLLHHVAELPDEFGVRYVVGVLKLQGAQLDLPYLRESAVEAGVEDLLDRCLQDADPNS
jgi:hypothetical protein